MQCAAAYEIKNVVSKTHAELSTGNKRGREEESYQTAHYLAVFDKKTLRVLSVQGLYFMIDFMIYLHVGSYIERDAGGCCAISAHLRSVHDIPVSGIADWEFLKNPYEAHASVAPFGLRWVFGGLLVRYHSGSSTLTYIIIKSVHS